MGNEPMAFNELNGSHSSFLILILPLLVIPLLAALAAWTVKIRFRKFSEAAAAATGPLVNARALL